MPRLMASDDSQLFSLPGPGNFQFSAIRIENLGATEYTLVTIVCDITGSVAGFEDELLKMIKTVVLACQKNPRAENLLLRVTLFNSVKGIQEIHGFKLLSGISPDDYKPLRPDGATPLFDATYDAVGATLTFAKNLIDQDFEVNGCVYIITDGDDNRSRVTKQMIAKQCQEAMKKEVIESLITVLVGININDPTVKRLLKEFKDEAQLTQYVDAGSATAGKLAKLANFVSQSISSQSQALGSGAASQILTF